MNITEQDCEKLVRWYREHENIEITPGEARDMLTRLWVLIERFHAWRKREEAAGRVFPPVELPPWIQDIERQRVSNPPRLTGQEF